VAVTRHIFLLNETYASAGFAVIDTMKPTALWADEREPTMDSRLTGRMAATPATAYRAYRSKTVTDPEVTTRVQIDLKKTVPNTAIQLFPASERMCPGRDQYYGAKSSYLTGASRKKNLPAIPE
jgi:hypothetical protein